MIDFEEIIQGFINKTLPRNQWTHQAHLIVSVHFCLKYDLITCLKELKNHIKAYNEISGTPNTDSLGYHETLTRFWIIITKNFIDSHPKLNKYQLISEFLTSDQAHKTLHLDFYTPETIFSTNARKNWVEPDRRSLVGF